MSDTNLENGSTANVGAGKVPAVRDYASAEGGLGYYNILGEGMYTSGDAGGSSFHGYLRALWYRKWIVLGVFLAVAGLGAANVWNAKPSYVSQATVEVQKIFPTSSNLNDMFQVFGQFDVYFQTQVMALRDRRVAEEFLVRTNRLPRLPESVQSATPQKEQGSESSQAIAQERERLAAIDSVLGSIRVDTVQGTQLIRVEMTAGRPEEAKQMLKDYLDTFISLEQDKRGQFADGLRTLLRKELDEAERQLKKSEMDLQVFTSEHGLVALDKYPDQTTSLLDKAGSSLLQSREKRLQLETMERAKDAVLPAQSSEHYIANLRTQLAQLKSEYSSMQALYAPDYFKLVLMRSKIQSMEAALSDLEQTNLMTQLDAARKAESVAGEAYDQVKQEALSKSPLSTQYEILKKIMEANGQMYVALLQRYKQATLNPGVMGHNVSIFSPPTMPLGPVRTGKGKVIFVAMILGLFGGIAVAIGLDKLDNTVRTTGELEQTLKAPLLGVVPRTENEKTETRNEVKDSRIEFMPFLLPVSQLADAIRIVENTTEALLADQSSAAVCVSSALPLEGKTFISVAMATVMSCENKRVLVIDGDLRRPRIQKLFEDSTDGPGLSDLLTGKCAAMANVIRSSHVPGLFYMTAGTPTDNPVSLLKSKKMPLILEQCRESFDVVIIDAPPLMGMADATVLARYTDGLILVTKQGHTPLDALRRAHESIQMSRVRLLGVVLNMVYRESGDYDYYSSKYSYRYHRKQSA